MEKPIKAGEKPMPEGEAFGDAESGGDVLGLLLHRDAGLGAGAACPDKKVRPARRKRLEIPGRAGNDGGRRVGNEGWGHAANDRRG